MPKARGGGGGGGGGAAAPARLPALSAGTSLTDVGANLLDPMFTLGTYHGRYHHPPDVSNVLDRAKKAGVERMIVTAGCLSEAREAIAFCEEHDPAGTFLFCTAGVHPTRVEVEFEGQTAQATLEQWDEFLHEHMPQGRIVALGECGLDDARLQFASQESQDRWLLPQLKLARKHKLPLFLHMRGCDDDEDENATEPCPAAVRLVDAIRASRSSSGEELLPHGAACHSFTGTRADLDHLLSVAGMTIGLNGCSLRTELNVRVAAAVPIDRLMLETDCPWCELKPTHASRALLTATAAQMRDHDAMTYVKKEKWRSDALVKGRCEPIHIIHVLHAVAAARRKYAVSDSTMSSDETCAVQSSVEEHAAYVAMAVNTTTTAVFFSKGGSRSKKPICKTPLSLKVDVDVPPPLHDVERLETPTATDVDRDFGALLKDRRGISPTLVVSVPPPAPVLEEDVTRLETPTATDVDRVFGELLKDRRGISPTLVVSVPPPAPVLEEDVTRLETPTATDVDRVFGALLKDRRGISPTLVVSVPPPAPVLEEDVTRLETPTATDVDRDFGALLKDRRGISPTLVVSVPPPVPVHEEDVTRLETPTAVQVDRDFGALLEEKKDEEEDTTTAAANNNNSSSSSSSMLPTPSYLCALLARWLHL
ncbi:hypothetical protein PPROV_000784300 [Pycnococcus provasolii]|uniref:TatD related DNase n=1 Tax=Pycnococcus provasolii TaxID=41880 RepID=A0A830HNS2_9CHLO|nr:hypothetical protein PPROV_000784300 [Pycnococcus provasolii]